METEADRKALVAWLGETVGGDVVGLERAPARREAWLVETALRAGGSAHGFLRLGRPGDPANGPEKAVREAHVTEHLRRRGVRVPAVLGIEAARGAVLYERVRGRSDLENVGAEQQQSVYRDYVAQLAALHRLAIEPDEMGVGERPRSAEACALDELAKIEAEFAPLVCDPLATFGIQWLRRHVPRQVEHIAFLHGDAGTPNFLFEGSSVTGLIDWEWAHFGDPHEDLGNAAIHASFHPSGDWPELLAVYEEVSGFAVDRARVAYYRAHLMVRSVLALIAATTRWDPHVPVALNLCFRLVSDRICCDSLAAAMGIELERPALPAAPQDATTLYEVVAENLRRDVAPAVSSAHASDRLDAATRLVLGLERDRSLGPLVAELECDELGRLLGRRPASLASGIADLVRAVPGFGIDREEELLRYLGRRAWRAEQLWAPVVEPFAGRELRPISN